MHAVTRLVLASQSPRRRELLGLLGLEFSARAANIAETIGSSETALAAVQRFAREKATAVAKQMPSLGFPIVVGADTIVLLDDEPLGKPRDAAEAEATLRRLRGREHEVYTALALVAGPDGVILDSLARSVVHMRNYSDEEIRLYVGDDDPLDKAGAYAIQHPTFRPVVGMTSCYANVMGLPLCHLSLLLREVGTYPPVDVPATCQRELGYGCPVFSKVLAGEAG